MDLTKGVTVEGPVRRSFRGWFGLGSTILLILVVPALVLPPAGKLPFEAGPGEYLAARGTDFVLIGNSVLDTRINPTHLESMADGGKVGVLTAAGGLSSIWYLTLKNQVVQTDLNPRVVFIFFRVDELTAPLDRISGKYGDKIEKLSGESEPEFDSIIDANRNIIARIKAGFEPLYYVKKRKITVVESIERLAAAPLIPRLLPGTFLHVAGAMDDEEYAVMLDEYNQLKRDANAAFDRANFRSTDQLTVDRPTAAPLRKRPFGELVADSFLPAILQLGIENDIPLVFVRIQLRPWDDGRLQTSEYIEDYIADLKIYVAGYGASFLDMHGNPDISQEYYLDGVHIDTRYKDRYTELFFREAAAYFE